MEQPVPSKPVCVLNCWCGREI
ncbi:hypothetical protein NC652_013904 [Populus alba x Populus x berolinensis]|uniref:Uncharacterized protein n=1 Tax=Populus alba x Populus x berolinensis TaxID=444605 RepID=A0AAD6W328_9ROSI|nr:hypothetical protein NC651_013557 [Populus alba x Populus x berolinensis]KAJ6930201.1 hypothetical protein NC652_013904 [Populus alba x Populus x berolinensis]KAJ6997425.1 hypothetical protein NC653_013868 [Populus alba x Populus x berolinensis]